MALLIFSLASTAITSYSCPTLSMQSYQIATSTIALTLILQLKQQITNKYGYRYLYIDHILIGVSMIAMYLISNQSYDIIDAIEVIGCRPQLMLWGINSYIAYMSKFLAVCYYYSLVGAIGFTIIRQFIVFNNVNFHLSFNGIDVYGTPPQRQIMTESTLNKLAPLKCKGSHNLDVNIKSFGINESCAICTDVFDINKLSRTLPCGHCFHAHCIDPWLLDRSANCPMCGYALCVE